jgi:hypothetical protein
MLGIVKEILSGQIPKLPSIYSRELRQLYQSIMHRDPSSRPTIRDILRFPLIKFKVMALLGPALAVEEIEREVFHGLPPGEAPPKEDHTINLQAKSKETDFMFMGRPLEIPESRNKLETVALVEEFLLNLIARDRLDELRSQMARGVDAEVSRTEEPAVELLWQLIRFENNAM